MIGAVLESLTSKRIAVARRNELAIGQREERAHRRLPRLRKSLCQARRYVFRGLDDERTRQPARALLGF
jgi:hypothetical protein